MTSREWVEAFAAEVGVEAPSTEEIDAVLQLAAAAAHGSERKAAPVATWLAGKTGKPIVELVAVGVRLESS